MNNSVLKWIVRPKRRLFYFAYSGKRVWSLNNFMFYIAKKILLRLDKI